MKRASKIILLIFILFLPYILFGQGAEEEQKNWLSFLSGKGLVEEWFIGVFAKLDVQVFDKANDVAFVGSAIGTLGALVMLAYYGWQMQIGVRGIEIDPFIKPIIIALILSNWQGFVGFINTPFKAISNPSAGHFENISSDLRDIRALKEAKSEQVINAMIEYQASEKAKNKVAEGSGEDFWGSVGADKLFKPIIEWQIRFENKLSRFAGKTLEFISMIILRVCVYLIFFYQKIWQYVLITLGPIAFGLALWPGFEKSMYTWISKFINISLYTFVAFTIINIGYQIIVVSYQIQIDRFDDIINESGEVRDVALLSAYMIKDGYMVHTIFPIVAHIVTGIGILFTPTIADSIVSAGNNAVARKATQTAKKAAKTLATKGA